MKSITLNVSGDTTAVKRTLSGLSGVLSVEMDGNEAIVHCGDKLSIDTLLSSAGENATVVSKKTEY